GALSRARMIREAQALAKLSHANVVTVYEVGEHKGHVFIAMEFVEGRTLRGWLKVYRAQLSRRMQKTAWRAIITVFAAAGRGLAAAHDAGIIHRDFKPTNVIVGPKGRVTVLDFGIAIAPERADTGPLTLAGTIADTPPYMAPEQAAGALVDPRADQYAFATCLYEALVGERPYKGRTLDERLRELLTEPPPSFPKGSQLPASLQRAVLRGLTQDPDLRFPSMREFIAAIELAPTRPLRRGLLVGTAALALAATGYGVAYQQVAPDPICESSDLEIADAWSPEHEEAIRNAFAHTDLSYADDTLKRLLPLLREYRDLWVETRRNACEANLRNELPTDLYGLEVSCLDRHKRHFASLTARLADADVSTAEQALRATRQLPAITSCTDIAALTSAVPPPDRPEINAEVEALRARLEVVRVEMALAHLDEARDELEQICTRADELDYLPLRAEAHSLRGRILLRSGDLEAAEQALRSTLWWADELRDDVTLASSMAALLRVLSAQARLDEALDWTPHARSVLARLGKSEASAAELSRDLGRVHYRRHDAKEALLWLDRARLIADALGDTRQDLVLSIDAARAAVFNLQGEPKASLEISMRVLEARIASLGPAHPSVATSLGLVGDAYATIGDHASSLPYYERALEIREAALGPDHPSLGEYLGHLGQTLQALDRPAEARPYLERALDIETRRLGAEHVSVTKAEFELGVLRIDLEDYAGARTLLERSHAKIISEPNS
ncbi:MAG TPA: tetratricopeptide repeat protein, partial [Nannocystis exedens]|nr:tetratricopeptide repeat protein [Nannocystis exedens]